MSELVPGLGYDAFVAEANRHRREVDFRASAFFRTHGAEIERLLRTPRVERHASVRESALDSLRVVHWNIEKGKQLGGIGDLLARDPELREAQIYCLNEVDVGMVRAGPNADVPRVLAEALECHAIHLPSFIECTNGVGLEASLPGKNARGLHGLAILTRLPVLDVRMAEIPACWDYFDFFEKRFGFRQGLYARLDWKGRSVAVGTTHLEVRRTPGCRERQFAAFLEGVEAAAEAWGRPPFVVTGDWNTNSFPRGGFVNSLRGFLRIISTPPSRLDVELRRPLLQEPLFARLERAGFELEPWNDYEPTGDQLLGTVEDLGVLPPRLAGAVMRASGLDGRVLRMRLDWIAARGLESSGRPRTRPARAAGSPEISLSDHALLVADAAPPRA